MGIPQLINLLLFWLFFGFLASYFAKKQGRRPLLWFFIGVMLGIFGLLLVFVMPRTNPFRKKAAPSNPKPKIFEPKRGESWTKMWYYLDPSHNSHGPIEFPDLAKKHKKKEISETSYLWGEGMEEWQRLSDLPDIKKELEEATSN